MILNSSLFHTKKKQIILHFLTSKRTFLYATIYLSRPVNTVNLQKEITDTTFDSLAPVIGIKSNFSSLLFLNPQTKLPDKITKPASPTLKKPEYQTNHLASVNILPNCDVVSEVSVDESNDADSNLQDLLVPTKACYYLIDLENVLIKPLNSVISDVSKKLFEYMSWIDSRGTYSTNQIMTEVKRYCGLLGDQIYHKLQQKHKHLDSNEFYSSINGGIADIIQNHNAPHPIREFQLPTFILSHNCQTISEAIVQAAGLKATTTGTIGTPPKMMLPHDEENFTHAVERMEATLGMHIEYEDILYISGDPKRLKLATNLGMKGVVYDYRQLRQDCDYASTLTPTKKQHYITDKEITAHLTDFEYSSSSNDSRHATTNSVHSSVDDATADTPSVQPAHMPHAQNKKKPSDLPLQPTSLTTVNYDTTPADLKLYMEAQQNKSIKKLEKKYSERESRLQRKHDAALSAFEKRMMKTVTRMQEDHAKKLGIQMKIDLDQTVEERRIENEEYIGTTTRQMEANWTIRSNFLVSTLEKKVHSAESRIDTILANCKKIEGCRGTLQSDQKAVAKLHEKSTNLVKDITKEKECFNKEAQRQINTLKSFCNTSKDRMVDANKYHDTMSAHDKTYALQIAQQKSQLHSHNIW